MMRALALRLPMESALARFVRYAEVDTESAEDVDTVPSTPGQWDLARLLVDELRELEVEDVWLSDTCVVYGKVPANLDDPAAVPVVGLIAHIDTTPQVTGANVKVTIHADYQGGDIALPGDPTEVITVAANPVLEGMIGDDIITSDGTTLLGSDDKAGIAAILTMIDTLRQNPEIPHGTIAVAFTPDEEPGSGIDTFDIERFGAAFAYTVDGEGMGVIYDETWNARSGKVTFTGRITHAGNAKGILVNSLFALADYVARLPKDMLPETTEGREGFVHPARGSIDVAESVLVIGLRDFETSGLDEQERTLRRVLAETQAEFPDVGITIEVEESYRNIRDVLKEHPFVVDNALEAIRRASLTPTVESTRGGTDGTSLTSRGLPTPDLFTGGYNFHSKQEFNSRHGLEKTTEMLVHLVQVVAEQGAVRGGDRPIR
ncbi:MAG TPA: peptidase T [Candidatus Limnocylindrales bacterium]|nr:peptidase T [Candidatus Limnocylindrales bacterium]